MFFGQTLSARNFSDFYVMYLWAVFGKSRATSREHRSEDIATSKTARHNLAKSKSQNLKTRYYWLLTTNHPLK